MGFQRSILDGQYVVGGFTHAAEIMREDRRRLLTDLGRWNLLSYLVNS